MPIQDYGKGHLPDPEDPRDYKAESVMGGAPQIDWTKEVRLPQPPDTDQGSSDCCVGESSSKLHWQLRQTQFAVRSIFAYIALPTYGAYIRDGVLRIKNAGQQTFAEVPDPSPKTPQNMRDKTGLDPAKALINQEFDAYVLPNQQLDYLAAAIQQYNGFIFGVQGTNSGWQNMEVPEPPQFGTNEEVWGHALYAMGYHTHVNPNGTTEKCIIAASSWCNEVKEHHIREHYFTTGNTNSAWVLIPKQRKDSMHLAKDNGTVYLVSGVNSKTKLGIADPATLALFGDEPVVDEDTSSVPESFTVAQGFIINKK